MPAQPILGGHKSLIVGIANDESIAYGCASAFRTAGAALAITWLNDKARPYVEPLGQARQRGPLHCLRTESGPAGRIARLFRGGLCPGDGRSLPFLRAHGETG